MIKETRYFMTGTDEEVLLGDVIEQVLTKDFKDGRKITRNVEFKLTEETILYALELGIIEEREAEEEEENNDLLDLCEDEDLECPYEESIQDIIEDQEVLEKRVVELEKTIEALSKQLHNLTEPKPNTSPKKKK